MENELTTRHKQELKNLEDQFLNATINENPKQENSEKNIDLNLETSSNKLTRAQKRRVI